MTTRAPLYVAPSLRRCRPIGEVNQPAAAAAAIVDRLLSQMSGHGVLVFVAGVDVYAVRPDSHVAELASVDSLVGRYSKRVMREQVADDLRAWVAAQRVLDAPRCAA